MQCSGSLALAVSDKEERERRQIWRKICRREERVIETEKERCKDLSISTQTRTWLLCSDALITELLRLVDELRFVEEPDR